MHSQPRYEVLGLIGSGDFASVHRARDRELGREVAIKQIHAQFLHDPQRLERFWREAQLLAAVEHPHIMTIYDIDRARGWLVLELMQGTLLDVARGQPLDLDLCRAALTGALQGLSLLHQRRTLHGDIKPSNLLVDRHGRVKLGDFGLARRVANDQGSYLKGATRYMAPELVAPQFGPVGPASDLYSVGFSMYELLCGPRFESLFPGLEAFGRDKQIAWMMWHATPDRRLPPISRVLAGVPEDIARVVDRLTQKDLSQRYRTAEDALADLHAAPVAAGLPEKPDVEAAKKSARQKRILAIAAVCCSLLFSVGILFLPEKSKPVAEIPRDEPIRGIVRTLIPDRHLLIVEQADTGSPKELVLRSGDRVFLNAKESLLRELREQDQVTITTHRDEKGRPSLEIQAARPQDSAGTISQIDAENGEMVVKTTDGQEFTLRLGPKVPVELNGETTTEGRPLEPADLKAGDRLLVGHFQTETGYEALRIAAERVIPGEGVLRKLDLTKKKQQATIAASEADSAPVITLPIGENCEVTLNGRRVVEGRLLTSADLKTGDHVRYERDVRLVRIAATRAFYASGTIAAIRYDVRTFTTTGENGSGKTYTLADECPVRLGGADASFDDLRKGDRVKVAYDSPDANSPAVVSLDAERPQDRSKWALIVACGTFDDASVPPLPAALADAELLKNRLAERYGVPNEQLTLLADPSRVRWEQAWSAALGKAGSAKQLLVVILGRGVVDDQAGPLLAPKDFAATRAGATGVSLKRLLSELDQASTGQKIAFLEVVTTKTTGADMLESIRGTKTMPLLRTTPVIAAAGAGPGLGGALANAIAGAGDANRDGLCELTELFEYLQSAGSTSLGPPVKLFLPDATPLRLSIEAREAIQRLARLTSQTKIDVAEARALYQSANKLAPKEPEPALVLALALLKARQAPEAGGVLEQLIAKNPGILTAWEASAWARFERLNYSGAVTDLTQWVTRLPKGELPEAANRVLPWAGRIRQYVADAAAPDRRPADALLDALDAAVKARGDDAHKLYVQGRRDVRNITMQFDAQIEAAADDKDKLKITFDRRSPRHYVSFIFDPVVQEVLARMEE